MFCSKCGAKNDANSTFCVGCGTPIKLPPTPPPMAAQNNRESKSDGLPLGFNANNNQVQQQSDEQIETQVAESIYNSSALTIANQITLAFFYGFLCTVKGSSFNYSDDFELIIAISLLAVAITYYVMVVNAVKKQKYQWALYFSIFLGILVIYGSYVSLKDGGFTTHNFYDWLGEAIGFIQVGLAFYVYTLIKSDVETLK